MKRRLIVLAGAAAMLAATALPAAAHHPHVIETPGTCVDRAGQGFGTGEQHDHTSFHTRVHTGTPGKHAFQQESNPVAVVGGTLCP